MNEFNNRKNNSSFHKGRIWKFSPQYQNTNNGYNYPYNQRFHNYRSSAINKQSNPLRKAFHKNRRNNNKSWKKKVLFEGTEEHLADKIKKSSAFIMRQILTPEEEPSSSKQVQQQTTDKINDSNICNDTNKSVKQKPAPKQKMKINKNNNSSNKSAAATTGDELFKKVINRLVNLSHGRKANFVNAPKTCYDDVIRIMGIKTRLEESLRQRQNLASTSSSNSNKTNDFITPDMNVLIDQLPQSVLEIITQKIGTSVAELFEGNSNFIQAANNDSDSDVEIIDDCPMKDNCETAERSKYIQCKSLNELRNATIEENIEHEPPAIVNDEPPVNAPGDNKFLSKCVVAIEKIPIAIKNESFPIDDEKEQATTDTMMECPNIEKNTEEKKCNIENGMKIKTGDGHKENSSPSEENETAIIEKIPHFQQNPSTLSAPSPLSTNNEHCQINNYSDLLNSIKMFKTHFKWNAANFTTDLFTLNKCMKELVEIQDLLLVNNSNEVNLLIKTEELKRKNEENNAVQDVEEDIWIKCENALKFSDLQVKDIFDNEKIVVMKNIKNVILVGTECGKLIYLSLNSAFPPIILNVSHSCLKSILCIVNRFNKQPQVEEQQIYIGCSDNSLKIYNFNKMKLIYTFSTITDDDNDNINCMDTLWDYVFVGCQFGTLLRFSIKDMRFEWHEKHINPIMTIKALQEGPRKVLLIGYKNLDSICIRCAITGLILRQFELDERNYSTVYSLTYFNNEIYCGTIDKKLLIFSFHNGQLLHQLSSSAIITCMKTRDNFLFTGCYGGYVSIYNVPDKRLIKSYKCPGGGGILSMLILDDQVQSDCWDDFKAILFIANTI